MTAHAHQHSLSPWCPCPAASQAHAQRAVPETCPACAGPVEITGGENPALAMKAEWPWAYACPTCNISVAMQPRTELPMGTLADADTHQARSRVRLHLKSLYLTGLATYQEAVASIAVSLHVPVDQCDVDRLTDDQAKTVCASLKALYMWQAGKLIRTMYVCRKGPPAFGIQSTGSVQHDAWAEEDLRLVHSGEKLIDHPYETAGKPERFRSLLPLDLSLEYQLFSARLLEYAQTDANTEDESKASDRLDDAIECLAEAMCVYRLAQLRKSFAPLLPGLSHPAS